MATYTTQYPGNTALQTEVWTLTLPEAKALLAELPCPKGSYWETTVARPYRRACRAKAVRSSRRTNACILTIRVFSKRRMA